MAFDIDGRIKRLRQLQQGLRVEADAVPQQATMLSADQRRWYVVALNSAAKYLEDARVTLERVREQPGA